MELAAQLQFVIDAMTKHPALFLILTATVFAALEPILPHHPVDRRRDLHRDTRAALMGREVAL